QAAERPLFGDEYLLRRWAVSVLDELPLPQRHAVVLHHLLDMTVPEICEELGIPRETVRSRLRLARTRLRARGVQLGYGSFEGDVEEEASSAIAGGRATRTHRRCSRSTSTPD